MSIYHDGNAAPYTWLIEYKSLPSNSTYSKFDPISCSTGWCHYSPIGLSNVRVIRHTITRSQGDNYVHIYELEMWSTADFQTKLWNKMSVTSPWIPLKTSAGSAALSGRIVLLGKLFFIAIILVDLVSCW